MATIWLGNWLGRKRTIFWGSMIMIIGAAIQAASYDLSQLIVARLITGFGMPPRSPLTATLLGPLGGSP